MPSSLIKRRNVSFTATKWFVPSYFGRVSLSDTRAYTRQVNQINENQNLYKIGKQILGKLRFSPLIDAPKIEKQSVWKKQVHASFRKVIAFDLLFLALGAMIGAGIITAVLK